MPYKDRVVVLVDMDCFYCQVEENLDPSIQGKPIAVVQYNAWRGGGIIAVNYPARDQGVTRHMRGDEAKAKCPDIELVRVPNVRGKADLGKYREAGKKVAEVLHSFTTMLERASVDEAYLDITEVVRRELEHTTLSADQLQNSHVVGYDNVQSFLNILSSDYSNESDRLLAMGGVLAERIRAEVYLKTGYKCSAGIAHNKILAKLVCGLHKPNQQTMLPLDGVAELYETMPIRKIKSLGGKFGNYLTETLQVKTMGELSRFTEKELASHFDDKAASFLYNIARGIDMEPVTIRLVSKSIGCCKKFPGRTALTDSESIRHWLNELAIEISERLDKDIEENNRRAKQMVISFAQDIRGRDVSSSRTHVLNSYDADRIVADAFDVIKRNCQRSDSSFCVKYLGISAGKFEENKGNVGIAALFKNYVKKVSEAETAKVTDISEPSSEDVSVTSTSLDENSHCISNEISIQNNESSNDSILQEITVGDITIPVKGSFFNDFFEQPPRDFNTSILVEEQLSSSSSQDSARVESNSEEKSDPVQSFFNNFIPSVTSLNSTQESGQREHSPKPSTSSSTDISKSPQSPTSFFANFVSSTNYISESDSSANIPFTASTLSPTLQTRNKPFHEVCPECSKYIPIQDFTSHMDYHFALQIVREEADLYKPPKEATRAKVEQQQKIKPKKRKINDNCQKLTSFLVVKPDSNEPSETCPECKRNILLRDMADHADYHAAKKLHLELNAVNKNYEKTCDSVGVKKSNLGIKAFFKEN